MAFKNDSTAASKIWNFVVLNENPKLILKINKDCSAMAANNHYLLYCSERCLSLLDAHGNEKLNVKRDSFVFDVSWSSDLNRFLILQHFSNALYSLDSTGIPKQQLEKVKEFDVFMGSCTCFEEKILLSSYCPGNPSFIDEYNLSTWELIQRFEPTISCKENQTVCKICYNSNGDRLGVILAGKSNWFSFPYRFEFRNPKDMSVLQVTVDLGKGSGGHLSSLPNQEFLVNSSDQKSIFIIDSTGKLKKTISYDNDTKSILSTTLPGHDCLVIQTGRPSELRFYDL